MTFDQSSAAQLDPKFKNVKTSIETTLDTTHKFDPVRMYVQDLDRAFDQTCLFFYDCLGGGDTICGVWKCKAIPKFKVDGTFNSYQEDGETRVNYDAMLAEMCRLGQGLVVEVSKKQ